MIEVADAVAWLDALAEGSVDLLLTSPPYEDARTYSEGGGDPGIARKAGDWVPWMLTVCRAARRACRGLCAFVVEGRTRGFRYSCSPFLLIADLHREGFHLRKPPAFRRVGIPGSGGPDWLRNDYEPVVCFTRGGRLPWADPTAMGRPPKYRPGGAMSNRHVDGTRKNARDEARRVTSQTRRKPSGERVRDGQYREPALANPGNVITCKVGGGQMGSPLCHENEAPFPERLAEFFVRSFCPPGGLVADPFAGSGTTLAVALAHGRRAIGCDLRPSQVELTRRRLAAVTPTLFTQ